MVAGYASGANALCVQAPFFCDVFDLNVHDVAGPAGALTLHEVNCEFQPSPGHGAFHQFDDQIGLSWTVNFSSGIMTEWECTLTSGTGNVTRLIPDGFGGTTSDHNTGVCLVVDCPNSAESERSDRPRASEP